MIVETSGNYGYDRLIADLNELRRQFPFIELKCIGKSVLGKDLVAIKIGTGNKHIHYNGAFHANEWITSLMLMKFIEDYAMTCQTKRHLRGYDMGPLYEGTSLWVVPMVNPDGVDLVLNKMSNEHPCYEQLLQWNGGSDDFSQWKANCRGVDLNDQFPAHWHIEQFRRAPVGPGPRDYVGMAPLCEPEALAMSEFTRQYDFQCVMAFHTQGKEIYWNYKDFEPAHAERFAQRLAAVSSYEAVKLTGSDAGYKDWFIQEYRRPGFTIEAGLGDNPLPIEDFPIIYEDVIQIMLAGLQESLSITLNKG